MFVQFPDASEKRSRLQQIGPRLPLRLAHEQNSNPAGNLRQPAGSNEKSGGRPPTRTVTAADIRGVRNVRLCGQVIDCYPAAQPFPQQLHAATTASRSGIATAIAAGVATSAMQAAVQATEDVPQVVVTGSSARIAAHRSWLATNRSRRTDRSWCTSRSTHWLAAAVLASMQAAHQVPQVVVMSTTASRSGVAAASFHNRSSVAAGRSSIAATAMVVEQAGVSSRRTEQQSRSSDSRRNKTDQHLRFPHEVIKPGCRQCSTTVCSQSR
jgi:hypothetical protein